MAWCLFSLTFIAIFLASIASAFSGNFELSNLVVSSPFQADPPSTESSYVEFDFCDQDTPQIASTHCCVEWAVGLKPPTTSANTCDNGTFGVLITSWHGVQNLSLRLAHTYIDNSVGQAPYNVLSKFADFNLTYPATEYYECDLSKAECEGCDGEVIIANCHLCCCLIWPQSRTQCALLDRKGHISREMTRKETEDNASDSVTEMEIY